MEKREIQVYPFVKNVRDYDIYCKIRNNSIVLIILLILLIIMVIATMTIYFLQGFKFNGFYLEAEHLRWLGASSLGQVGCILTLSLKLSNKPETRSGQMEKKVAILPEKKEEAKAVLVRMIKKYGRPEKYGNPDYEESLGIRLSYWLTENEYNAIVSQLTLDESKANS